MLNGLLAILAKFTNYLIAAIGGLINLVLMLLPDCPFEIIFENFNIDNSIMSAINWVIPFSSFITIGVTWLVAIAAYYAISSMLRFAKLIG